MELKNNEIMPIYDASIVYPNTEDPSIAAFKSIGSSLFNNIVIALSKIIMTTNLIILGHTLYENKIHYKLIITFQIGVFIIELLGKYFIIGLIKYLFEDKEDNEELYNLYIRMKTSLVILIPIVITPISIYSYFLLELLLINFTGISDQTICKEIYLKFLIFTPIIYLFEILFFLNLQFLHYQKQTKAVFTYLISFLIAHIALTWILLYILEIGITGLTISYCINTFLFYFFTNNYVKNVREGWIQNFFLLIPKKENFDGEIMNTLKRKSIFSLINLGEIFIVHFLFILSIFTDENQLVVNIIYMNFYELILAINRGIYYSLKRYISTNVESMEKRQKYVATFSLYYLVFGLSLFLILFLKENILLDCYLYEGGEQILKTISEKLRIIFSLSILLNCFRNLLNGMIRGMNIPLSLIKKIGYYILCMILSYVLCFYEEDGILGLWKCAFALNLLFVLESGHKAFKYLPQFFHNYI
jgi:Na+-driven multidrug efflux pump